MKRIYIANDDHTDYLWSADEATYEQAFLNMIDYYLDLADTTASEPSEYQSRFNTDGNFWMWTYEKNKPAADFQRLIDRIKDEHITVPLNALVSVYGAQPVEAVLRGMYYPGRIERQHNLRFMLATVMENQTLPCGLVSLWAGSGAKYSWRGICGCDTQVPSPWDRSNDIYNWVGPDGSSLIMKWNSMLSGNKSMGGYAEAYDPFGVVDYVDSNADFIARYPYDIIGAFGKGWDNLQTLTDEFITAAKAGTNASRQVIVSNELDFFRDFEQTYGSALPSESVSYGNEWELYSAAIAEQSARVKRSVEKLRGAEALATLVSLQDPDFMTARTEARNQAFMDLGLYWEHNIGNLPGSNVSNDTRIAWQKRIAGEISDYVNALRTDAANALGGMIRKSGTNTRFYVFNPLSWTRTDFADLPYSDMDPVHVIDLTTCQETPSQIVTVDGERLLRIQARDVPTIGYKVFEIVPGAGSNLSDAATVSGNVIENTFYRITVSDRGAITSLVDKERGREFAQNIGGRVINDLGSGSGILEVENTGPVSVTLKTDSTDPLNHTTRITLFRDSERIDIRNDINQNFSDTFTWGFGFNLPNPDVWHEEVGAIIRAKLSDEGGHYSSRNARYDWLTMNHFVDMSNGSTGITLSNADTEFMKLGNSSVWTLDTNTPQISALAGGHVTNGSNGLPNQGGDTHFLQRFALKPHDGYDQAAAMRFALEHQNPLIAGVVTGGTAYPETFFSLVTVSNPDVLVWALKPADDGIDQGIIARVWNLSGSSESFSLSMANGISSAQRTTHIETPLESAMVTGGGLYDTPAARQIRTYLIKPLSIQPTCAYSVYPTSQSFTDKGGTGCFAVTTANGCNWTATSNASWIIITSGLSGTGDGIVKYSVTANSGGSRTGTITVEGKTFTVIQDGSPGAECSTWTAVINKYNSYVSGQAAWNNVIECYNQYVSP